MTNLDDSIGELLLNLQKDDPETFHKLMKQAQKENPELFEGDIDEDNKKIDEYNRKVDEYNKKVEEE
jgi:hypothetical protein